MRTRSNAAAPFRLWSMLSEAILKVELFATTLLLAALLAFILANVVTRYLGSPLYWIDELAVFTMVWLAFIGTSAMTRLKLDFAVDFLAKNVPARAATLVSLAGHLIVGGFGAALIWMSWIWLDPAGLVAAGFDPQALAAQTFNFLYLEYTQTLGWPRWAVMMVVPIFGLTIFIHSIAGMLEDLSLIDRPVRSVELGNAEEVA